MSTDQAAQETMTQGGEAELDDPDVVVIRSSAKRLDELRPLSVLNHGYHVAMADPRRGLPRNDEEFWELRRERYAKWLSEPESFLLIAESRPEGKVLGYVFFQRRAFPRNPDWNSPEEKAWVEDIVVRPDVQGARIGKRLIDAIKCEARRMGLPALGGEVLAHNQDALRFYEREGGWQTAIGVEYTFEHEPGLWNEVPIVEESGASPPEAAPGA